MGFSHIYRCPILLKLLIHNETVTSRFRHKSNCTNLDVVSYIARYWRHWLFYRGLRRLSHIALSDFHELSLKSSLLPKGRLWSSLKSTIGDRLSLAKTLNKSTTSRSFIRWLFVRWLRIGVYRWCSRYINWGWSRGWNWIRWRWSWSRLIIGRLWGRLFIRWVWSWRWVGLGSRCWCCRQCIVVSQQAFLFMLKFLLRNLHLLIFALFGGDLIAFLYEY